MLLIVSSLSTSAAEPAGQTGIAGTAEKLQSFSGGFAAVCMGGKWGFIDTSGKTVIKFMFREVGSFNSNLAPARVDKQKWGYINKKGLFVINPRFDDARPFSSGYAPVKKGDLWGFIDTKGRLVHDYSYEDLKGFYSGLAPAKRVGKWGYINKKGTFVLKRQWLEAGEFREGLAPVKDLENQWGYIDTNGIIKIESQFDEAKEFSEKLAAVKVESKWGFINYKGRYRINPQYEEVMRFSQGYAAAKKDGKWGYVDRLGHDDIPFIYDEASDFSDYIALVAKDGLAYYIDDAGVKTLDVTMKTGAPAASVLPVETPSAMTTSALDFDINYVSPANCMGATGARHKDDAVYLIKIKGAGLNRDQMFKSGFNGFRYEIEMESGSNNYKACAYPITGVKYSTDALSRAELNPEEIAFYWLGPKQDGAQKKVKITQIVRDFNSSTDKILAGPLKKTLPIAAASPKSMEYSISFYKTGGENYYNGVCAFPMGVRLTDNQGFDAPSEVYDRLVFYSSDEKGAVYQDKVIGADPSDENYLAIIPESWGGKIKTPKPRYGFTNLYPQETASKGRIFYVFAKPTTNPARLISVELLDGNGTIIKSNDFSLNSLELKVTNYLPGEPNSEVERTLTLVDSARLDLSDPMNGDFDFVFEKPSSGASDKYYVIALMPEGMSERDIQARYNFSTFVRGFYMKPVNSGGKTTGFNVSDRTSALHNTYGRPIFAFVFDIYGRYDRSPLFTDDQKIIAVKPSSGSKEQLHLRWINFDCANISEAGGNRFMMALSNNTPLPVVYYPWGRVEDSSDKYKNRSYSKTAIIVGPGRDSYYATGDDQHFHNKTRTYWEMEGYSLFSGVRRFHNQYLGMKTAAGPSGFIRMKSVRTYRGADSERPYGADGKFSFFYPAADRRATNWIVRYDEWKNVYSGFGYYDGKTRSNFVRGGDFNGTMHTDKFNQNTW